ncbi:glycosyltransferase [Mucilaginibacter arboris]|uniref:Glycosyltransferase n=1 Tax=Mucilaginibacter arboris TaxID=2682090 RepID=A0A7K1SU73_9SPHI|nr:glycosyltransferase [Mucilaginibacter arboris]MVN20620.1 glycosyltransferase [Mucilaginibacter arboris]
MKILLIADPGIPVPPEFYGGHERLVYLFAEEYQRLGHQVTLLAGPESSISGKVYTFGRNDLKRSKIQKIRELIYVWYLLTLKRNQFDVIHNFGRLLYLLPVLKNPVKKIMTYGRGVSANGIQKISTFNPKNLIFTACSNYCVSTGNVAGNWRTVYNAINFSDYFIQKQVLKEAPLMFLGRLDKIKGVHTAIKVAKATNHTLWIGGNIPDTLDNYQYYKQEIEPYIDGKQIIYLGALNNVQKNQYLRKAKALLFPIEWNEPFGLVMIEAMACGTPVIGFKKGSVAEVIEEGITGLIVNTINEMINAVDKVVFIDRYICKKRAEAKFDIKVIARQYLNIFDNTH